MSNNNDTVGRRRFLQDSAAILGSIAVGGSVVETVYGLQKPPTGSQGRVSAVTADIADALVKIRGRNHFLPVRAWISDEAVKMVGADTASKRRALVTRLLHENEQYVDIVTGGGEHAGELRFYIGVPHEVKDGSVHDVPETAAATEAKCVTNYICCTWSDGKKECCARWKCCDLA